MWRSALTCRSVRRAAEASPQAALAMPLIVLLEDARADDARRHAGVGGVAQRAFATSVQTTSTGRGMMLLVTLCSLRLIMCGF